MRARGEREGLHGERFYLPGRGQRACLPGLLRVTAGYEVEMGHLWGWGPLPLGLFLELLHVGVMGLPLR